MRPGPARLSWLAAALVLLPLGGAAETVYVIDRLLVGVHAGPAPDTPLIKAMPTGTALEVLERGTDRVRVRTPEGLEGWVDASYVMLDKPALLRVPELEARLAAAERALATEHAHVRRGKTAAAGREGTLAGLDRWRLMLLGFGGLLAFALGGYAVDWESRRRHGGFRV